MSDAFSENKELVKFYQNVRTALTDILTALYFVDSESVEVILKDLDQLVAERTKKIIILETEEITPLLEDTVSPEDLELHIESIKSGIFNLVVTMCMHYMNTMSAENARMTTIQYLESITDGLRQLNEKEEQDNA